MDGFKIIKKRIKIPIYKGTLIIMQIEDFTSVADKYDLTLNMNPDNYAALTWKDGLTYYMAVTKDSTIPEIAHESFHIATYILFDRGYIIGEEKQEAYAYLVEWVMEQCCMVLKIER